MNFFIKYIAKSVDAVYVQNVQHIRSIEIKYWGIGRVIFAF